ncbi:DUF5362 family protein [Pedobacter gandavensis]|uniref:DUF5362 domain-containing protein n=1 Tax=Pedobacter gandavensis TaxID=2679963 RepID=A0ABR6EZV7_9SPHI|nr:DUF5362 family protein [Pedobacter gandavensis]MBB2150815.1 hypothetical protein [Pedobacter gandavensis]
MEEFEETKPDHAEVETLIITEDIRSHIYETAKWAKFLSIVGFVFSVLIVIAALCLPAILAAMSAMGTNPVVGVATGALSAVYIFFALLYFYPSFMLFKYANTAKKAVLFMDQESLGEAMSKMKSFFKFWGILTITIIALYAVVFLITIVATIGAAT